MLLHNMYQIVTPNNRNSMREGLLHMTLLLNDHIHPKVYKKRLSKKNMSNQTLYRVNHITEFINHQKAVNNQLAETFEQASLLIENSKSEQNNHYETLLARSEKQEGLVNHFINEMKSQATPIQMIVDRLDKLEKMNEDLFERVGKEGLMTEAIMAQLSFQDQSSLAISKTLGDYEVMYQQLVGQQRKQEDLFDEISNKLIVQEAFHQTIMEQLDQQKALTKKLSNKLDDLKEVITEKVANFTDKLEENYKLTTNFIASFLNRSGFIKKSPTMLNEKEEVTK